MGYLKLRENVSAMLADSSLLALFSLIIVQIGCGIILKTAEHHGTYRFSPSSSVAISEMLKFLISTCLLFRQYRVWLNTEAGYALVDIYDPIDEESLESSSFSTAGQSKSLPLASLTTHHELKPPSCVLYIRNQAGCCSLSGLLHLALVYAIINNTIFVCYKLADPGTIQLSKSSMTLVTVIIAVAFKRRQISKTQWAAIILQVSGLAVTQYNPEGGSIYPVFTYAFLLLQVLVGAAGGVYNEHLLKSGEASLHFKNAVLYAAGATVNLAVHFATRIFKHDEPSILAGYNDMSGILVIASNTLVGLVVSAVYNYADAVIKCVSSAFSTGVLLWISLMCFGLQLHFLAIPGTTIVFVASWLYISCQSIELKAKADSGLEPEATYVEPYGSDNMSRWPKLIPKVIVSSLATMVVVALLVALAWIGPLPSPAGSQMEVARPQRPDGSDYDIVPSVHIEPSMIPPLKDGQSETSAISNSSPVPSLNSTLALIRFNSERTERLSWVMKYKEFFHTLHFSMPDMLSGLPDDFQNITHDQYWASSTPYVQVARTMDIILQESAEITGLFYFHFDAWIDPMAFEREDLHIMWLAVTGLSRDHPDPLGPLFLCIDNMVEQPLPWWARARNRNQTVKALQELEAMGLGYRAPSHEGCSGWSDIYYIPRRFFLDYIFLADLFNRQQPPVFHEVAIPTILGIIDKSRRPKNNPFQPLLTLIGDCYGSCCDDGATPSDILQRRCGHRLDFRKQDLVDAHFNRIDEELRWLNNVTTAP